MIWTETAIRDEIRRLDKKTGLYGAELEIKFGKSRTCLGKYTHNSSENKAVGFYFSNYYFADPDWPQSAALDVIRHEYAHYMACLLYNSRGHDKAWKSCCIKVGARPERLYTGDFKDQPVKKKLESNVYEKGMSIIHPVFGRGVIENVTNEDEKQDAVVKFNNVGVKKLSLAWMQDKCRIA